MPRRPRSVLPRYGVFHVTVRGVARQNIVRDEVDRDDLVARVIDAEVRFGWLLHAYCVLDNHFHLVVECLLDRLSTGMHRLNGMYAQRFNNRHERCGHLFQERFATRLVGDDEYLTDVCAYVLDNAARAGLCAFGERWRWSGGLCIDDEPAVRQRPTDATGTARHANATQRNAFSPVSALPTTRVCTSCVPS